MLGQLDWHAIRENGCGDWNGISSEATDTARGSRDVLAEPTEFPTSVINSTIAVTVATSASNRNISLCIHENPSCSTYRHALHPPARSLATLHTPIRRRALVEPDSLRALPACHARLGNEA